jgi:hypothetical protein
MTDTPQAIRREIVNVGEKSWKGTSTRQLPKKSGIDLSIPSRLIRRQGRVAGRRHVRERTDRFPENLGAIA